MPIHITEITIYQSKIKLKKPFVISLGVLSHAENCIVQINSNSGLTGFGECSPFKTIHGESIESCYVIGQDIAKHLIGKNALEIENLSFLMDNVIYGNASIKSAFDMALYDIASQNANIPLYRFLGGENKKDIFTDYTVSFGPPEQMAIDALEIIQQGFPIIKVKLGGTIEEDILRMKLIRKKVGMEIPIRIDANQGWTVESSIKILKELYPLNIQHCEEPISKRDFMNLPKIKKESPIPIMADESCCDDEDAKRLIDLDACDSFNIKLGKSSGIFKALKIVRLAEQHKIPIQMGGFLESRLGFTAAAHLAMCTDMIMHFDFDTPLMFEQDPVVGGINYQENGRIVLSDSIGLGARFEEDYLKHLIQKKVN